MKIYLKGGLNGLLTISCKEIETLSVVRYSTLYLIIIAFFEFLFSYKGPVLIISLKGNQSKFRHSLFMRTSSLRYCIFSSWY